VTADSIKADVYQFVSSGDIKGELANSLLAKLDAAAAALARGQCGTADNIYQAFIHEVQAQSGKGISATRRVDLDRGCAVPDRSVRRPAAESEALAGIP
jgi:hypothetical protein